MEGRMKALRESCEVWDELRKSGRRKRAGWFDKWLHACPLCELVKDKIEISEGDLYTIKKCLECPAWEAWGFTKCYHSYFKEWDECFGKEDRRRYADVIYKRLLLQLWKVYLEVEGRLEDSLRGLHDSLIFSDVDRELEGIEESLNVDKEDILEDSYVLYFD